MSSAGDAGRAGDSGRPAGARRRRRADDGPVLPDVTDDERDVGWGGRPEDEGPRDDDWYRRERPPHHG